MDNSISLLTGNLMKSYGRVEALHDVNLEIHSGEIFGLLGPSGAGKTTTFRCLYDLIRPNSGIICVLSLIWVITGFFHHIRRFFMVIVRAP